MQKKGKVIDALIEDAERARENPRNSVRRESIRVLKALMETGVRTPDVMLTPEGNCVAWWKFGKHYLSATCLAKDKITSVLYTKLGYKAFTTNLQDFKRDIVSTGFSDYVYGGADE